MDCDAAVSGDIVLSRTPFVIRRRARWAECDPAGVVFAGNFSLYVHHALDAFRSELFGRPWHAPAEGDLHCAMPTKALSLAFHRALWPGELFDIRASVSAVGDSTVSFSMHGSLVDGTPVFDAGITSVCIAAEARRAIPVPDWLRRRIEEHRASCSTPEFNK